MEQKYVKYVALYLRKSRGDIDNDLTKHRDTLVRLCVENEWKYVEYTEIGSGDSIHMRPVFQKLLNDIEEGVYDAVCVMDIDRLGRGDLGDQDKIKKAFIKSNTYVITPQQTYNLNDDNDEFVVDMKSFIARREYKQILKRLSQGKKIGSRLGMWTNGKPPYPYEYQSWNDKINEKGLVVNDDKLKVYRFIIDSFIKEHKTPENIAIELNKSNVPSPNGSLWYNNQIRRLLLNEVHLGKIISNKTKGDGHKNKKPDAIKLIDIPKSEWVIVENCHQAVITQIEHDAIMLYMSRLHIIPRRTNDTIRSLSGLIKCGLCGHTMSIGYRSSRKTPEWLETCWYKDPFGVKCGNSGIITPIIYEEIQRDIVDYKNELEEKIKNNSVYSQNSKIDEQIVDIKQKIKQNEKALEKILDAYENSVYSLKQFKERKDKNDKMLIDLDNKLKYLLMEQIQNNSKSLKVKYDVLNDFITNIDDESLANTARNDLYKRIIDSIIFIRKDDNISIEVKFK